MLEVAAAPPPGRPVRLDRGERRRALPFEDGEFDALTFTYLLRYVDDPAATLRELARVVRPGGTIAGLEFGVPRGIWRPPWELWVRVGLPAAGRPDRRRLARGRLVPRPLDPRLRPALAARPARRAPGTRPGIDDVRGRQAVARRRERDVGTQESRKAGVLRPARRRLARLRDAAAPAVHALEPLLRGARRRARAARSTSTGCCGGWPRSSSRSASRRTPSTS